MSSVYTVARKSAKFMQGPRDPGVLGSPQVTMSRPQMSPQICLTLSFILLMGSVIWLRGQESTCRRHGWGRSPGEGNGNPLQYSCWEIPWTEEPGGIQSVGSQRVGRLNNKQQQPPPGDEFHSIFHLTNALTDLTLSLHSPQPKLEERGLKGRDQTL